MGCFNGLCAISRVPIKYGDEVYLIPLEYATGDMQYTCYGTAFYRPTWLPIRGTYDDYGRIENIHNDFAARMLLSKLRKEEGEPDTPKSDQDMLCNEVMEYLEEGQYALVHEEVYHRVVDLGIPYESPTEHRGYLVDGLNNVLMWYASHQESIRPFLNRIEDDVFKPSLFGWLGDGLIPRAPKELSLNSSTEWLIRFYGGSGQEGIFRTSQKLKWVSDYFEEQVDNGEFLRGSMPWIDFRDALIGFYYFVEFCMYGPVVLTPFRSYGQGGICPRDLEIHRIALEFGDRKMKEYEAMMKEEEEGWEDEEE
jgi:hypothetical protein